MQKQGQVGVYKLFKLGRGTGGLFTTDFKNLERDVHVVTHEYAEKTNRFSHINGLSYEYCEKETKLYWDGKPFKAVKVFTDFEEIKEIEVKDAEIVSDIDTLKAEYEKLSNGKKAHHLWKEDKLIEKIAELKK
jgi:hypothetical protein